MPLQLSNFVKGMYPQTSSKIISSGDHITTLGYDYRFGEGNYAKGPNGLVTQRRFDNLGRMVESIAADKTLTQLISFYCNDAPISCPDVAIYGVATRITNGFSNKLGAPLSVIFYDKLQREVRRSSYSLGGVVVNVATEYRNDGRVDKVSEPYSTAGSLSATSATAWTQYSDYDALGRARTVTGADGSSKATSFSKDGVNIKMTEVVTVKNTQGGIKDTQTTARYINPLGQVVKVEDAAGTPVTYDYSSAGKLKATLVNNNDNTKISIIHDSAGNKTHLVDPDAGVIDFEYNGFGELRRQIWQKGTAFEKSITTGYDELGREIKRVDRTATGISTTYEWTWDTKKKGLLSYERSGNNHYVEYSYDSFSRINELKTYNESLGGRSFTYSYDEFSRPDTITYPNGFRIQRVYHAAGNHVQTKDISDSASPRILWAMGDSIDIRGNLTTQLWGNGVVTKTGFDVNTGRVARITSGRLSADNQVANLFGDVQALSYSSDSLGNLEARNSARTDTVGVALENLSESFVYDRLNRLKSSTIAGDLFARNKSYDYDELGNLTKRSSFSTVNHILASDEEVGVLSYARTDNAGVHAVTAAGGVSYQYDKYGNMTGRGSEAITYDVFNKPTRISGASATDIFYGADRQRFKEINGGTSTYTFVGGAYEEVVTGTKSIQKSYVDGVIIQSKTLSGSALLSSDISYLHGDNLGSVDAIS